MPFWAPIPVPTITAVGVARPRAQGQAIASTVIPIWKAKANTNSILLSWLACGGKKQNRAIRKQTFFCGPLLSYWHRRCTIQVHYQLRSIKLNPLQFKLQLWSHLVGTLESVITIHLHMCGALPSPQCWVKQILVLAIIVINIGGRHSYKCYKCDDDCRWRPLQTL